VASDSENMSSLKNYLILSNDHMKSMVASFIYKNVNLKKSEYANIEKFINNIDKWSIDTPQHLRGLDYDGFYTFVQSIKNSVNDICKTIPTIILNNKSGINGGGIPKHWNISGVHSRDVHDFISSYYEFRFTRKNELANVLDKIYNKTRYPVVCEHTAVQSVLERRRKHVLQDVRQARYTRVDDVLLVVGVLRVYPTDERSRPDNDP
jgi:hypothetical protein